ncbi:hypothetical protein GF406_25000 [candidate division KSB1 bacterium]|nr:hypothetical protein [candidate division KSB1 bacterium]
MMKSKPFRMTLIVLFALLILEGLTDFIEIGVGQYMLAINGVRPKIGRLWDYEGLDEQGQEKVAGLMQQLGPDTTQVTHIEDLQDLMGMLSVHPTIIVKRDHFLTFYRSLGSASASRMVEPAAIYNISRHPSWKRVRMYKTESQLVILFLDGRNQLLADHYTPLDLLLRDEYHTRTEFSPFESDPRFTGRVMSARQFLDAFDSLTPERREAVIPDLYKLIEWGDRLMSVAISRFSWDGQVTLAFQIRQGAEYELKESHAEVEAVASLITKLNAAGRVPPLMTPIEKEQ